MDEGWNGDEHFIVFDVEESRTATKRYRVSLTLPGYEIVGLRGWDDFIVRSVEGQLFTVPTVPLDPEYLKPFSGALRDALEPDARAGTIKWYIKPLVFGGSPELDENVVWVDHLTHGDLVCWWNQKYREAARGGT